MTKRLGTLLLAVGCAVLLLAGAGRADQADNPTAKKEENAAKPAPEEKLSVTEHAITASGVRIGYTARAGTILLRKESGAPTASIFFVAYTAKPEPGAARPVTFCFNGGPGSSSVWLHLGAFGPKRVTLTGMGPPYFTAENEHSLLDLTDLIFVDPVTTGYSRAAPGEDPKQFHGVEGDIESMADFIRLWVTRFQRWPSPKFLLGESYGGTRAAALAAHLQNRDGLALNGVVLVSPALDFQTFSFDPGNDLPFLLFLPTYAATAWYHDRLAREPKPVLNAVIREAEAFSEGDYGLALLKGSEQPEAERSAVRERLSKLTGLSPELIDKNDLRIRATRFSKELLAERRGVVGRFDGRIAGDAADPGRASSEYDPSYESVVGPFSAALNDYLRTELRYEEDLRYEVLTPRRVQPWNYGHYQNRYLSVAEDLREAMVQNPALKVFVASGYYDLATPYFAQEYSVRHLGLPAELRRNVSTVRYESGHMIYTDLRALARLKADLAEFFRAAVRPGR